MNKKLISWSQASFKDLPWRRKRTLYKTLVSEIMLQQTTVTTVKKHFEKFLLRFPDIKSLAQATEEEVLLSWQGLGYYRRARNLKKAAESIYYDFHGVFPKTVQELIQIPGIGIYTANALLAIGQNLKALALDANLERVLSRYYGIRVLKGPKLQKQIFELFEDKKIVKDINKWGARALNEALMDCGRVYCQAKKVDCLLCPLNSKCEAAKLKSPTELPLIDKKIKKNYELKLLRIVVIKKGAILGARRKQGQWLSGQIELPTFILHSEDSQLEQYPLWKGKLNLEHLPSLKTGITKYKIDNVILNLSERDWEKAKMNFPELKYYSLSSKNVHFSTTTLKILDRIKE
ncbi:MAG: hypothetical protein OEY33_08970 [Bdellovibrionales bacterium]|jgi:A/G-specific adenine glycosylase|nr:hypothetical protein [Bdellovibrionales bacterium]